MDDEDAGHPAGPIDSRRLSPVRRTVTALVATGLLFVAACADEGDGSLGDLDRRASTTTTSADTTGSTEPDEPTTSTTPGEPGEPGEPDDPSNPDGDPGNNEICEGQTPVWAFAPADPGDPVDPESKGPAPRAERASLSQPSRPQQQPEECTTPEPQLGTGDIQITLRWESAADLDLHVTEPNGTEIWYSDKGPTSTGGQLDVDSNVGCEEDGSVENVFWPEGEAPQGQYLVEVDGYRVDGCGSGEYTLVANVRGREVLRETGTVAENESDSYRFEA
jgi:hypothetical protein